MYKERAQLLAAKAAKEEKSSPQQAAMMYLDAAELLLVVAKQEPYNEQKYMLEAKRYFTKSQELASQANAKEKAANSNTDGKDNIPSRNFTDVVGLATLKEEIRLKIIEPMKHPEVFARYGKSVGGGILMYGPPGCGKSLIAEATAGEAGVSFFHVKASDLKSKYVGETEQNITELFEKARAAQPAIIFFDEFEAIGKDRSIASEHDKNFVAQLLVEMDGYGNKEQQILLLAATNEPWAIDPALLREGRLGTTLYVSAPDDIAREALLRKEMAKRPTEKLSYSMLAQMTNYFSAADIIALCNRSTERALRHFVMTKEERAVTFDDFLHVLDKQQSSLLKWYTKAHKQLRSYGYESSFPELQDECIKAATVNV